MVFVVVIVVFVDKNWEFKQFDKEDVEFFFVFQFLINVYFDFIYYKIIFDFFIGKNEFDVQWVGEV